MSSKGNYEPFIRSKEAKNLIGCGFVLGVIFTTIIVHLLIVISN